jgi:hypothetical protein
MDFPAGLFAWNVRHGLPPVLWDSCRGGLWESLSGKSTFRSELLARMEAEDGNFGLFERPIPKAPPFGRGLFTLLGGEGRS